MGIRKTGIVLKPDMTKSILKPFEPGDKERIYKIIDRVFTLSEEQVINEYESIKELYVSRHRNTEQKFVKRFNELSDYMPKENELSLVRQKLIGSYFVSEYTLECAALFNPSMIWHPNQSGLKNGEKRFIISIRATGEGHISSLVFKTGIINSESKIILDEESVFCEIPEIKSSTDIQYDAQFDNQTKLSERVMFPQMPAESNGIEDARFVLFEENGRHNYYATYTAYDGHNITTQLLYTRDFLNFTVKKMTGNEIKNKGMALFPRKVNGKYVMLSRQDNENNFIMYSDKIDNWDSKELLMEPKYPWEFFQIGNCGSPIETEKGWLCLSHGVGAARRYTIGVFLLDKDNPSKVIGRSKEPILEPDENERNGYVPNVVYSCGSALNGNDLIIPYAMSDFASSFAIFDINELLEKCE
ncbi:MAG: glycoside hydrolase family 130 protein [Melioribacteraceae bacterium]|nr:glycoside hydrolase family 130 protein [Melioribacteraceae bacterium]